MKFMNYIIITLIIVGVISACTPKVSQQPTQKVPEKVPQISPAEETSITNDYEKTIIADEDDVEIGELI